MAPRTQARRDDTGDLSQDSDDDGFHEETRPANGRAPRKNAASVAARRDQNRIAQREFRQRKQQRIRDLEMKVEILSAEKDEGFKAVNSMVQDLIAENQVLRQLVKDLSMFVGDGIGGAAGKIGMDPVRYEDFLGRGETDTAHLAYQNWKKNGQRAAVAAPERNQGTSRSLDSASAPPVLTGIGQKRPGEDIQDGTRKRARRLSTASPPQPHSGTSIPGTLQIDDSPYGVNLQTDDYFPSRQNASPSSQFAPHYPTAGPSNSSSTHGLQGYQSLAQPIHPPHMSGALAPIMSQPSSHLTPNTAAMVEEVYQMIGGGVSNLPQSVSLREQTPRLPLSQLSQKVREGLISERGRLIRYHLDQYKKDPSYNLPACLRPTVFQRTVPHDPFIDGIVWPQVRDKLIVSKGTYDLADFLHELVWNSVIHSDDMMDTDAWEVGEGWFVKYGWLGDASILATTNKWRKERGLPEIPSHFLDRRQETTA